MTVFKTNDKGKVKNICPTCGNEFEEHDIKGNVFKCTYTGCPEENLELSQLITYVDDYLWCI